MSTSCLALATSMATQTGVLTAARNRFIGRCLRWRCVRYTSVLSGATTPFHMYHGTELTSLAMLAWSAEHRVRLHYIAPGKPTQNAFIESFNGKFRDECLNENS